MPELPIVINGRSYRVTCGPGEEKRLMALAGDLDRRVNALVKSVGQAGEGQLLVLAGILMADELDEARAELARLKAAPVQPAPPPQPAVDDVAAARTIDALASRIEAIAARLERT